MAPISESEGPRDYPAVATLTHQSPGETQAVAVIAVNRSFAVSQSSPDASAWMAMHVVIDLSV